MTRTRRLISGVGVGYVNQFITTVVGIWLTAFLLLRLGQENYGLWLLVVQVVGFLGLLDLGVTVIVPREIAFATGRERRGRETAHTEVRKLVGQTANHVLMQIPIVILIGIGVLLLLPQGWAAAQFPLAVVLLVYVATFPLRIFQATLSGLQDFAAVAAITTASWLAGTLVTVALVLEGFGLYSVAIGWSVTQILIAVLGFLRLRRSFPDALPRRLPKLDRLYLRERIMRHFWVSTQQVAHVLLSGTDLLIIGKVMGPLAVVPYFCTAKIITVLRHQPQLLMDTATPALSELRTGESPDRLIRALTSLNVSALLFSGLLACLTLVVNEGFVGWWVGSERFAGLSLTLLLVTNSVVRHMARGLQHGIFAYGEDKFISMVTLSDGVVTVGVGVVLVYFIGLPGVVIASLAGALLIAIPANLIRFGKCSGTRLSVSLAPMVPWLWRFSLVLTLSAAIAWRWRPQSLVEIVAAAVAITIAYVVLMAPVALREPVGTYLRPRLGRFLPFLRRVQDG
ncbi:MAG: oligosaccharide flippase family protein [Gemmatimonadetes bacterium]|nr:oligosaccharide flippase family protein [Gemmatimonadota bacterium]